MAERSRLQRLEGLLPQDPTPSTKNLPIRSDEQLIEHVFSMTPETGGQLALTDQRLIFAPWRFTALTDVLAAGFCPVADDPELPAEERELQLISGTVMITLKEIARAEPGRKAAFNRPPGIAVVTHQASVEFGIMTGPYKRNRAPANLRARDAFVESVNEALRGGP